MYVKTLDGRKIKFSEHCRLCGKYMQRVSAWATSSKVIIIMRCIDHGKVKLTKVLK